MRPPMQRLRTAARSHAGRPRAIAYEAEGIDRVANDVVLVGPTEVVVHPRKCHHGDGFGHATEIEGCYVHEWEEAEEQAAGGGGREPMGGERAPGLVDAVFEDRGREALVRDIEEQAVEVVPKDGMGEAGYDGAE